jgi:hypothetical protein
MQLHRPHAAPARLAGRRAFVAPSRPARATAIALAEPILSWSDVTEHAGGIPAGYVVRPGRSPATVPSSTLPTAKDSHLKSIKQVVLYRDGNAWCPYCERVRGVRRGVGLWMGEPPIPATIAPAPARLAHNGWPPWYQRDDRTCRPPLAPRAQLFAAAPLPRT